MTDINSNAVLIEVVGIDAGIAVRDRRGFQFVAVDPRFGVLDGSRFASIRQAERAARQLATATGVLKAA